MFRLSSNAQPPDASTVLRGAEAVAHWRRAHPGETLDLRQADLRDAVLATMDLRGANLAGADLTGANLSGTKLHQACLHDANLTDAQLQSAEGLLAVQLAGANLTGASLPATISTERLETAARCGDAADYARAIFMWMIGGCGFVWLMLISTSQLQLLTNDGAVKLPVFEVEAPSEVFFLLGPFLLIGVYYYLHVYLQRIWDTLASLPAVFPDGEPLDRKTHGWMVLGLVRWQRKRMQGAPPMFYAQTILSLLLTWGLAPATVYAVWHRCAIRHEWNPSMIQVVACALITFVALGSLLSARAAFCPRGRWAMWVGQVAATFLVLFGLHGVMQKTFHGESDLSWFNAVVDHYHPTDRTPKWGRSKRELQNEYLENSPFLVHGFQGQRDPAYSVRIADQLGDLNKRWREVYAEFSGPLLAKAHLQGAMVVQSDLSSSDLSGSLWHRAKLLSVDFTQASLNGAKFLEAEMNDVVLLGASASGADFSNARAYGFIAMAADFTDATLNNFDAIGMPADFRNAKLDRASLRGLKLMDARLQGASLRGADLSHAMLVNCDLSEADLTGANLNGADLRGANLTGAVLAEANLTDAKFGQGVSHYGNQRVTHCTVLDDADLRGAQGQIAPLVALSMYNDGTHWDGRQSAPVSIAATPETTLWDGQPALLPSLMPEANRPNYPNTGLQPILLPPSP